MVSVRGKSLYFQLTSNYHFLPGKITGELTHENNHYQIKSLYLGRVAVPKKKQKKIEDNLKSGIDYLLSKYSVRIITLSIENSKIVADVEAPKGLIKVRGNDIIIDLDALSKPIPESKKGSDYHAL